MTAPATETYAYDVLVAHEAAEGTWGATVPTLPGSVAQRDSREGALEMIRVAIQLHLAALLKDGAEFFDDSDSVVPEVVRVSVDLRTRSRVIGGRHELHSAQVATDEVQPRTGCVPRCGRP